MGFHSKQAEQSWKHRKKRGIRNGIKRSQTPKKEKKNLKRFSWRSSHYLLVLKDSPVSCSRSKVHITWPKSIIIDQNIKPKKHNDKRDILSEGRYTVPTPVNLFPILTSSDAQPATSDCTLSIQPCVVAPCWQNNDKIVTKVKRHGRRKDRSSGSVTVW